MAEIIISSFFQDAAGPRTGLTPTIRIYEVGTTTNTLIVGTPCGTGSATDGVMTEVIGCASPQEGDGGYKYIFTDALGYDTTKTYQIHVDGGVILPVAARFQSEVIPPDDVGAVSTIVDFIRKFHSNRTFIDDANKQLILFDDDNTTILYRFDLFDNNGNIAVPGAGNPSIAPVCEKVPS